MPPEDDVRVRHLIAAASKAVSYAAQHVSPELRNSYPQVPWSAAARMRDRLVHHYF